MSDEYEIGERRLGFVSSGVKINFEKSGSNAL
jgi:hypothetical protein